jgi:hypothetical protein
MDTSRIIRYLSFEEVFLRRSSFEDFRDSVALYSKESVIYLCCLIGTLLEFWKRGGASNKHYEELLKSTFEPNLAAFLIHQSRLPDPGFVFHRRQLLLIEKTALICSSETGADAFRDRSGHFGRVLLMANDHLHYGRTSPHHKEQEANILTEFVAVNEFAGSRVLTTLARARIMRNRIAPELKNHRTYVDIPATFLTLTGISLQLFESLCGALFTKYNTLTLDLLKQSGDNLYLRSTWFYSLPVSSKQMAQFVDEIGATDEEYKRAFSRKHHFGHNDFTAIKDRPVYLHPAGGLPLDLLFIVDKFATGPFWRVHNSLPSGSARQDFRSFWGQVFEMYVHRIMQRACVLPHNIYVPNPIFTHEGVEACDAVIVCSDAAVFLEYKSNMFTAEAKYSGNSAILVNEIERKLIRSEEGKKKGVSQLAATLKKLFATGATESLKEVDLSQIKTVYPVLVTLDDIGGSFLISRHLDNAFQDGIGATGFRSELTKMPLFCINIEALEVISGYLGISPAVTFLDEWIERDAPLASSILAVDHPSFSQGHLKRNAILDKEFDGIWKEIMSSIVVPSVKAADIERNEL